MYQTYKEMKSKHLNAVLLFRVGDFYEAYEEDAKTCHEILGITLVRRVFDPKYSGLLVGFPYHALDTYLPKLIRAGKRVCICEPTESDQVKKLAKRGINDLIK